MYTYEVTWLLASGEQLKETFEAETYSIEPNGIAVFIVFPKVANIEFTANPQGGPPQRPAEAVGTVGGYNIIKRVNKPVAD